MHQDAIHLTSARSRNNGERPDANAAYFAALEKRTRTAARNRRSLGDIRDRHGARFGTEWQSPDSGEAFDGRQHFTTGTRQWQEDGQGLAGEALQGAAARHGERAGTRPGTPARTQAVNASAIAARGHSATPARKRKLTRSKAIVKKGVRKTRK